MNSQHQSPQESIIEEIIKKLTASSALSSSEKNAFKSLLEKNAIYANDILALINKFNEILIVLPQEHDKNIYFHLAQHAEHANALLKLIHYADNTAQVPLTGEMVYTMIQKIQYAQPVLDLWHGVGPHTINIRELDKLFSNTEHIYHLHEILSYPTEREPYFFVEENVFYPLLDHIEISDNILDELDELDDSQELDENSYVDTIHSAIQEYGMLRLQNKSPLGKMNAEQNSIPNTLENALSPLDANARQQGRFSILSFNSNEKKPETESPQESLDDKIKKRLKPS